MRKNQIQLNGWLIGDNITIILKKAEMAREKND